MEKKIKWTKQDSDTLSELHETTKYYKELYSRVANFYTIFYKISGIICMISSAVSTTIFWIDTDNYNYMDNSGNLVEQTNNDTFLKILMIITFLSTVSQNIVDYVNISNEYTRISNIYQKIQFKIENIGDIHPSRRNGNPKIQLPSIRDMTNKLSQDSNEINPCFTWLFHNRNKVQSYMAERHEKYSKEEISDDEFTGEYSYSDDNEVEFDNIDSNRNFNSYSISRRV